MGLEPLHPVKREAIEKQSSLEPSQSQSVPTGSIDRTSPVFPAVEKSKNESPKANALDLHHFGVDLEKIRSGLRFSANVAQEASIHSVDQWIAMDQRKQTIERRKLSTNQTYAAPEKSYTGSLNTTAPSSSGTEGPKDIFRLKV